ncbi:MAG TPA: prepilin-type N-terminal cleavage/methylation domain-containing protein [Terriglobales bacterium]|nr:prepilin-type N-terminal cleavage/methylation domain-containing protein [Terriglobales bacterium]
MSVTRKPKYPPAICRKRVSARDTRSGFSMVELLIVVTVMAVMTAIAQISLRPLMNQAHVTNAYNTSLMALRLGREKAVEEKGAYKVTFNGASAITVAPVTTAMAACGGSAGAATWTGAQTYNYSLPSDVSFQIIPGVPTGPTATPDGFGIAAYAVDFDQLAGGNSSSVIFCADGSAQDSNGQFNNGVVYMARTGELYSSRAITLWGITGRLRGWRLLQSGSCGTTCWSQQ